MKILLNCHVPFMLAHGGAQIQIEQTKIALEKIGLQVEYLRWWDDTQTGDILHHFARIPTPLLRLAHEKGMKVVLADLLTEQGSRTPAQLRRQRLISRLIERTFPSSLVAAYNWQSYRLADACVALTTYEAQLMHQLFDAPTDRLHVVPNGVEEVFLQSQPQPRGPWLICTATITERKRVLETAQAAIAAQTPLWIIGKPYSETDPYSRRFLELAKQHPRFIRYEGPITDRDRIAQVYRQARGFVLLSTMESLSLSALEAAACECPLLLSDLPWARTTFKDTVSYAPIANTEATALVLKKFYDTAPTHPLPDKPLTWLQVAQQLKTLYTQLLTRSNR